MNPTDEEKLFIMERYDPHWQSHFYSLDLAFNEYYRSQQPAIDTMLREMRAEEHHLAWMTLDNVLEDIARGLDTTPWMIPRQAGHVR